MVKIIHDQCSTRDHENEVRIAVEVLQNMGYSVINIRKVKSMFFLWGENITEIYYEGKAKN